MKAALLTDCYLPRVGGIEVQVHDLGRGLVAAGHDVEVVTATGSPHAPAEDGGVRVHRLTLPGLEGTAINPLATPRLRRLLAEGGFDVVHVQMGVVSPFSMAGVEAALGLGLPVVVTWHCVLAWATPAVAAAGFVQRWAARGALMTAVSPVAARPLEELTGRPVQVLPNGIDLRRWAPAALDERAGADDGVVRVVTAMRLAARKRPRQLLQVAQAARALAPGVDLRLEVYGEGPWRPVLERWVERRDARAWVALPGRQTHEQLRERYRAADLYVAPARLEAFGIAALEARATGLPVVGPAVSGISGFVRDGVEGLLTTGGDDELARALARLATDDALRRRIREHNRTVRPAQSWPLVVEHTVGLYEQARSREPVRR